MVDIVIDNVTKSFGSFVALARVDLHVVDGEFLALLGPAPLFGVAACNRQAHHIQQQSADRVTR